MLKKNQIKIFIEPEKDSVYIYVYNNNLNGCRFLIRKTWRPEDSERTSFEVLKKIKLESTPKCTFSENICQEWQQKTGILKWRKSKKIRKKISSTSKQKNIYIENGSSGWREILPEKNTEVKKKGIVIQVVNV